MEGPIEAKDSNLPTEEPVKLESVVQNPNDSNRSDGAASPPPNCSICLGKLINTSFTDSCLHQFCFTCLLQWSKIKTECPLCKQTFKSIIHNVRSEEDYDQYHVPREMASTVPANNITVPLNITYDEEYSWNIRLNALRVRSNVVRQNRRYRAFLNAEQVARREQLPSLPPQVSREECRRRRGNPVEYRRTIYRLGMWANPLPNAAGRFRECSASYYRVHLTELDRLGPWLCRELLVLLNNAPHVAYVLRIIMDALIQYDIRSPPFRDIVRPYFGMHTDHFVHEFLNYARSNFDLVGYDQSVVYSPPGLSNEMVPQVISPTSSSSSSTSEDSDVRVVDEAMDLRVNNTRYPPVGPHAINMPGPSTVHETFGIDRSYPNVFTVSSSSTEDDDCEVIGYVKSRHERTPEIIELLSSDSEDVIPTNFNSNNNEHGPTSTGNDEDIQYAASTSRRHTNKEVALKIKTMTSTSDSDSDYEDDARVGNKRGRIRSNRSMKKGSSTRKCYKEKEEGKRRVCRKTRKNSQQIDITKRRRSVSSDASTENEKLIRKKNVKRSLHVRKDLSKRPGNRSCSTSSTSSSSSSRDSYSNCTSSTSTLTTTTTTSSSSTSSTSSISSSDTDDDRRGRSKKCVTSSSKDETRENENKTDQTTGESSTNNFQNHRYNESNNCNENSLISMNKNEMISTSKESRNLSEEGRTNSMKRSASVSSDRSNKPRQRKSKRKDKRKDKKRVVDNDSKIKNKDKHRLARKSSTSRDSKVKKSSKNLSKSKSKRKRRRVKSCSSSNSG